MGRGRTPRTPHKYAFAPDHLMVFFRVFGHTDYWYLCFDLNEHIDLIRNLYYVIIPYFQ